MGWKDSWNDMICYKKRNCKNFYNSILFSLKGPKGAKAIKVFRTGILHITGYTDVRDALEAARKLMDYISKIPIQDEYITYDITDFEIQMINVCYKIPLADENATISLQAAFDILRKQCPYYITLNTNEYAGLVINAPDFKVLFFSSGHVILTSIQDVLGIEKAFKTSYDLLGDLGNTDACKSTMFRKKAKSNTEHFDYGLYLTLK